MTNGCEPRTARVADIITIAAEMSGIRPEDITGKSRKREFSTIRQAVYYVARLNGHSYPKIATIVGGRDHSSVVHGRNAAFDRAERDEEYARFLAELIEEVGMAEPFFLPVREKEPPTAVHVFEMPPPDQPIRVSLPKANCKAKNDFRALPEEQDGSHRFHNEIADATTVFAAALAAARTPSTQGE